MVVGPKGRAAWTVKDAQYFGPAQRRERVVLVADFGGGADPAAVLFEPESVRRDSPPSRETGQGVATYSASSIGSYREAEVSGAVRAAGGDNGGGSENLVFAPEIARCVATREGSSQDYETTTMVAVQTLDGREGGATAELGGEVATALRASQGGGDKPHVLAGVSVDLQNVALGGDVSGTLDTTRPGRGGGQAVLTGAVRRLTPVECERLMGFPDNYTRIPWRGKPADQCPDGPRYKALGNSWAVPLFAWLGARIARLMPRTAANDNTLPIKDRHAA